ncbi:MULTISPECIES: hypothetical protein [unclassified Bradyrhizobium]|jgi:hypothetical protein|uniref:hypothetical protein n=1 Tax=unclassified Bradyrhizobium TaxID=2631580 RepID=UPI0023042AF0|nr:hypothetical protein [Bradyrhizobium sp. CCBAU 25338]MDA9531201.1 hypothetical protein [Bradyrhizobium sp. CCBAU 25338]
MKRQQTKQTVSFQDRVSAWAEQLRKQAARLKPGRERADLLAKVRQADVAAHLDEWVNSRGLQPPK